MKTRMIIKDRRTDGAAPVDVNILSDDNSLIIQWGECDMTLPYDDVMNALAEGE